MTVYGFAAGDRVLGVRLGDLIGAEVRYQGSDGCMHAGYVTDVYPWDGHPSVAPPGTPFVKVQVGYADTFMSAERAVSCRAGVRVTAALRAEAEAFYSADPQVRAAMACGECGARGGCQHFPVAS